MNFSNFDPLGHQGTPKSRFLRTACLLAGLVLLLSACDSLSLATRVAVSGISLDKTSATVAADGTLALSATVIPGNATDQGITWASSNPAVATVTNAGVVTGIKAGSAVITAASQDGGKTASCTITVSGPTATIGMVSGLVTLPASVMGKIYSVYVDTNAAGDDGYIVMSSGVVTGSSFTYTLSSVPAGTYYLYFVVNQGPQGAPVTGDYLGFYGATSLATIPTASNLVVTAGGTISANIPGFLYESHTPLSSDATLSALNLAETTISPPFSSTITNYTASVAQDVTSVTVNATKNHASAVLNSGTGSRTLNVGANTLDVVVTAPNGTAKTYTIVVTRAAAPSVGATLSGTVTLPSSVTGQPYTVVVDTDSSGGNGYFASANVEATGTSFHYSIASVAAGTYYVYFLVNRGGPSVSGDYIGVYGATSLATIPTSANVVIPATGTVTANIQGFVYQSPILSSDATLSALSLAETTISPPFSSTTTNYTASVAQDVTSVTVRATKNHDSAVLKSGTGSQTLAVGANPLNVLVTAQDGTSKTYTVTVTRAPANTATASLNYHVKSGLSGLITIDQTHPLRAAVWAAPEGVTFDLTTPPLKTMTLDGPTASASTTLPPGWYLRVDYSDRDNDGKISVGDWIGTFSGLTLSAAVPTDDQVYPYPTAYGAQRALAQLSDLNNMLWVQYSWNGTGVAPTTETMALVITSKPNNITDKTGWVVYTNGGGYQNQRGALGVPSGTYGYFFFEDKNYNSTLDTGETYYWTGTATFPSLPSEWQTTPFSVPSMTLKSPPFMVSFGANSAIFANTTPVSTGTVGTIKIN